MQKDVSSANSIKGNPKISGELKLNSDFLASND